MSSPPSPNPSWKTAPPDGRTLEGRAAALVQQLGEPKLMPPAAQARVASALRESRRRFAFGPVVRWSLVAVALVSASAGLASRRVLLRLLPFHLFLPPAPPVSSPAAPAPTPPAPAPSIAAPILSAPQEDLIELPPPVEPAPLEGPSPKHNHRHAASHRAASEPAGWSAPGLGAQPPNPALQEESDLLRRAIQDLRNHDAAAALAQVAQHEARFPQGVLRREIRIAELNAYLLEGDRKKGLGLLDQLAAAGMNGFPRSAELRVLRGDLLAQDGRYRDAIAAYDEVLATAPPQAVVERALYGRASTLGHLGDAAGSRADLKSYLDRYPQGRFASEARRALDAP